MSAFPHVDSVAPGRAATRSLGGFLRAGRILALAPGVTGDAIWWEAGRVRAKEDETLRKALAVRAENLAKPR